MACGDGLGGFGGRTGGVLVAAGVEGDVGDDGRMAVVGVEACGGKGDATISQILVENWPAGWRGATCVVGRSNRSVGCGASDGGLRRRLKNVDEVR